MELESNIYHHSFSHSSPSFAKRGAKEGGMGASEMNGRKRQNSHNRERVAGGRERVSVIEFVTILWGMNEE